MTGGLKTMVEGKDSEAVPMVLSVNLYHKSYNWETCLLENRRVREYFVWEKMGEFLAYVTQITTHHPSLLLALVTDLETRLCSLTDLVEQRREQNRQEKDSFLHDFLHALGLLDSKCVHLPAIKYAPGVPQYRRLFCSTLGSPRTLCVLATLLYRMRQQDADWLEMTFFYLELHLMSYTLVVVKEGLVVDGASFDFAPQLELASEVSASQEQTTQLLELAFWERLTRDLSGLVAIHHIEDIVLLASGEEVKDGENSITSDNPMRRQEGAIERLGDTYKFYLFPQDQNEQAGHETAFGACLLAEGLLYSSHGVELAQRLILGFSLPS